ncbi:MAG: DEAD/DEAH box helicase [Candidatus Lokiarchaeota archaeon]|nr:DEAD/DEAH box helicase [Candidatus Lokiarchaeota archaeon]
MASKDTKKAIEYLSLDYIKKNTIEIRDYQVNIAEAAFGYNSLVVLPTALGKTIIGIMLAARYLKRFNGSKILVLAPTKPLVMQHFESFREIMDDNIKTAMLIGNIKRMQRAIAVNNNQILFSTPQIIKNDITLGSYSLKDFSLAIFDEAHKARKRYAYTFIAEEYMNMAKKPYILGLTASPGKNKEVINTLIEKLHIEKAISRTNQDDDVKEYIYPLDVFIKRIDLPIEVIEIQVLLKKMIQEIVDYFVGHELLPIKNYYSKVDFIRLNQDFRAFDLYGEDFGAYHFENVPEIFSQQYDARFAYISMCISAIYLLHMEEILTTQTPQMFVEYYQRLIERAKEASKSAARVVNSKYFKGYIKNQMKTINNIYSPKVPHLLSILEDKFAQKKDSKVIVFTQFRDMASIIKEKIMDLKNPLYRVDRFVGQYSKPGDKGLSQKKQKEMIDFFKKKQINILVATSIAEEGLDIPDVDLVIFYEPVPSEIRLIQRRGRTGRHSKGACRILVAKNTLDEVYLNVAFYKEAKMEDTLISQDDLNLITEITRDSDKFVPEKRSDKEIIDFFRDIEERKKLSAKRSIELIESINESEAEKSRKKLLKKYGVTDLTQDIGRNSIHRLKKTEQHIKDRKKSKKERLYQRRKTKIEEKIKKRKLKYQKNVDT